MRLEDWLEALDNSMEKAGRFKSCRYFIFDKRSTFCFDSGLSGGAIASPVIDITIHDTENILGVR